MYIIIIIIMMMMMMIRKKEEKRYKKERRKKKKKRKRKKSSLCPDNVRITGSLWAVKRQLLEPGSIVHFNAVSFPKAVDG